jgi:hypothetical protein
MSLTKGFRFKNIADKEYVISVVNKIADRFKDEIDIQGDAVVKLCRIYDDGVASIGFAELPHSVQETINTVKCEFIKNISGVFQCYETYHKNKKTKEIGSEHDKVITACNLCRVGKARAIQTNVENQFRKKGISSMVKLVNDLLRIDHDGAVAQIFLCQSKRWTHDEIIISSDQVHMKCPELENELILIDEYCVNQIDPHTLKPPCRYLVAPYLKVPIEIPEETRAIIEDIKQLENQEPESEIKTVDAEFEVKEGDDNNE